MDDSGKRGEIGWPFTDIDQLAEGACPWMSASSPPEKTCSGSILKISAVCDAKTGMYTVKIRLDDKDSLLHLGLMADVTYSSMNLPASVYISL